MINNIRKFQDLDFLFSTSTRVMELIEVPLPCLPVDQILHEQQQVLQIYSDPPGPM